MNAGKGVIIINVNKSCSIWALLILGARKLFGGGSPMQCWMGSSIPDLYPMASPLVMTTKISPDTVKHPLRGKITPR